MWKGGEQFLPAILSIGFAYESRAKRALFRPAFSISDSDRVIGLDGTSIRRRVWGGREQC